MTNGTWAKRSIDGTRGGAVAALALVGLMAVAAPHAQAQTTYTSSSAFLASLQPGYYTNPFTGASGGSSASYAGNGYAYTLTSSGSGGLYSNGDFIGADNESASVTVTFTSGNVTAVGANFYNTDINDGFLTTPVSLTVNFLTGTPYSTTYSPTSTSTFFGITSTSIIMSVVENIPSDGSSFAGLDNLTTGARFTGAAASPEPGVLPLLGSAVPFIGAFVAVRRRRRRISA